MSNEQTVTDVDMFYKRLMEWHHHAIKQIRHLTDIPEGTEVSLDQFVEVSEDEIERDGQLNVVLHGENHLAFIVGVMTAMSIFEQLPFRALPDEDESTEEAKETIH